jgi:hypothetical protein
MIPRIAHRDIHGDGGREYEIYDMPGSDWSAITDVPCPVEGCEQTLLWYEAGYVPGYRVCMAPLSGDRFDHDSIRHRFHRVDGTWSLVRDACCEGEQ